MKNMYGINQRIGNEFMNHSHTLGIGNGEIIDSKFSFKEEKCTTMV
jgi:hypothetical protein